MQNEREYMMTSATVEIIIIIIVITVIIVIIIIIIIIIIIMTTRAKQQLLQHQYMKGLDQAPSLPAATNYKHKRSLDITFDSPLRRSRADSRRSCSMTEPARDMNLGEERGVVRLRRRRRKRRRRRANLSSLP